MWNKYSQKCSVLHRSAGRGTRACGSRNRPLQDLKFQPQREGRAGVSWAAWLSGQQREDGHRGQKGWARFSVRRRARRVLQSGEAGEAGPGWRGGGRKRQALGSGVPRGRALVFLPGQIKVVLFLEINFIEV